MGILIQYNKFYCLHLAIWIPNVPSSTPSSLQPADCAQGIQPVSAIPDLCVTQNINTIMGAWPPTPSE